MFDTDPQLENREKLALVWAERRQRLLAVRVRYDVRHDDGCTFYHLRAMDAVE
jgi:hypothetical protein